MPPPGPVGPAPGWPAQTPSWSPGYPPGPYPQPVYSYSPGHPTGYLPPWQPGVIPLRPLMLSDIFNGAAGYVRVSPKPTLGLTTAIVLVTTVLGFITGLAAVQISTDVSAVAGLVTGAVASLLATTVLSGMLTVIVARAVMGVPITIGESWRRVRGRIPTLIGLVLLEIAALAVLIAAVVALTYGVARTAGGGIAALVGFPLGMMLLATLAYLYAALALAPVAVVLENKGMVAAIRRSITLCSRRFWRTLGILLLAGIVARLVSAAISVPFDIALTFGPNAAPAPLVATALATVGAAIGGIITTPFVAGVVTLLYLDARIRSEAFDFALLRAQPGNTDEVWLAR